MLCAINYTFYHFGTHTYSYTQQWHFVVYLEREFLVTLPVTRLPRMTGSPVINHTQKLCAPFFQSPFIGQQKRTIHKESTFKELELEGKVKMSEVIDVMDNNTPEAKFKKLRDKILTLEGELKKANDMIMETEEKLIDSYAVIQSRFHGQPLAYREEKISSQTHQQFKVFLEKKLIAHEADLKELSAKYSAEMNPLDSDDKTYYQRAISFLEEEIRKIKRLQKKLDIRKYESRILASKKIRH